MGSNSGVMPISILLQQLSIFESVPYASTIITNNNNVMKFEWDDLMPVPSPGLFAHDLEF